MNANPAGNATTALPTPVSRLISATDPYCMSAVRTPRRKNSKAPSVTGITSQRTADTLDPAKVQLAISSAPANTATPTSKLVNRKMYRVDRKNRCRAAPLWLLKP